MQHIVLGPFQRAHGDITLPGSKSISNRVLLLAALATGTTRLKGLLDADDTRVMREALGALGITLTADGADWLVTGGAGRFPHAHADLFMGNAGTAIRPLTAALALLGGDYRLHGVPRMHERPIGDLVDGLRMIGAVVEYEQQVGYPPIRVGTGQIRNAVPLAVRGDVSSQFLTALLLALPLVARTPVTINVVGALISTPYVELTMKLMTRFGVHVSHQHWQQFVIPGCATAPYHSPGTLWVEGDASSASYFLAAGAIAGGPVRVHGVGQQSIQGDVAFVDAIQQMGARVHLGEHWIEVAGVSHTDGRLRGITIDCLAIPDAAMTLAVMALFATGTTTLTGIGSWRVKETDRIAAMHRELRKVGAIVTSGADWLSIEAPAQWQSPAEGIDTYDDHRMAMCFSLASFAGIPIRINEPGCVAKTFPDYFDAFAQITHMG